MSDTIQLGQHLDADQLSAFAEQALPAQEREQTLAHLAGCADCRNIVALSLPPIVVSPPLEQPKAEPVAVAKPWFGGWVSGWRLAWIAIPAFAAIILVIVHVRNTGTDRGPAAGPLQVAKVHPPLPQEAAPQKTGMKALKDSHVSHSSNAGGAARVRKPIASGSGSDSKSPPADRRTFTKSPSPAGQAIAGPIASNGATKGMSSALGLPPWQMASGQANQSAPLAPPKGELVRKATPAILSQAAAAKAGPPVAPVTSANTFVGSPVGTYAAPTSQGYALAASSAPRKAFVSVPAHLPSGQPILSFAMALRTLVAIDIRHALFYSEDEGRHWQPISPPWQGRAVTVATVSPTPSQPKFPSFAVPERFTPGALDSPEPVAYPDATGISLSGTVTDASGAVVPGAAVVATEGRYSLVRTEKADAAGHYLFTNLVPGIYRIDTQAPGFAKSSLVEDLVPAQQAVRDLVLSVGHVSETVTVDAASMQLEPQSSTTDLPLDNTKSVEQAPVAEQPRPIFVITTDSGERWVSSDGHNWERG